MAAPNLSFVFDEECTSSIVQQVCKVKDGINDLDLIKELLGMQLPITFIAKELSLTVDSVRYAVKKYGLKYSHADITDEELDIIVTSILEKWPTTGHKALLGMYSCHGPRVSRERLRQSLNRVREVLHITPPMLAVRRRVYYVKGPLSMMHIDGYHGLTRWRFVIHGGIDGYSRAISFLNLSNNNRAATVLKHFKKGVRVWGLPVRVRSDKGTENVGVCDFMLAARPANPFITGRSIHNQRIERAWRDVFQNCVVPFYNTFYQLEYEGILNPSDNFDIYCLHFVATKLLSEAVDGFMRGWNAHPISTESNFTPNQLFVIGLMRLRMSGLQHEELIQSDVTNKLAEREANMLAELSYENRVVVPPFACPLSPNHELLLTSQFNPNIVTLANLKENYLKVKSLAQLLSIINL